MAADYLTPDDVASHLQVSRQVVYNWINDGRLRAVKAGRTLRIPQYALDAFLQPVQAGDVSKDGIEPEKVLLKDRFTPAAQAAVEAGLAEIIKRQHTQGEVEHQLWALLQPADGVAQRAFRQLGVDPRLVLEKLEQALAQLPTDPTLPGARSMVALSPRLHPVVERTEAIANQRPDLQIDASHMLEAIGEETEGVTAQILKSFGVTPERLRLALLEFRDAQPPAAPPALAHRDAGWEQRTEQTLARIETELAAIRAALNDKT